MYLLGMVLANASRDRTMSCGLSRSLHGGDERGTRLGRAGDLLRHLGSGWIHWLRPHGKKQKTDVTDDGDEVVCHVGILVNERPGPAGLLVT